MKTLKLLSFSLALLSFHHLLAQTNGRVIEPGDPNGDPTWDWRVDQEYTIYFKSGTNSNSINSGTVRLPYYTSGGPFEDINSNEIDYHPEDGWRLIYRDFGWSESSVAPTYPFFALYNLYTGILRFFHYAPPPPVTEPTSYALVEIKFLDNLESGAVLTFNDDNKPFKEGYDNSATRGNTFISNFVPESWGYADFNIFGFDPDLDDQATFVINIYKVEESTVDINGSGSGDLNQVLTVQNPTRSFSSTVSDLFGAVNQGVSFAKSAGQVWDIFKSAGDKAGESGGVIINGVEIENIFVGSIESNSNGRTAVEPVSIIKGAAAAVGFLTKFLGGESQPVPLQFSLNFNLDLDGTITTVSPVFTASFAIPHPNRFDNGTGSYYRPLYVDANDNDIPPSGFLI